MRKLSPKSENITYHWPTDCKETAESDAVVIHELRHQLNLYMSCMSRGVDQIFRSRAQNYEMNESLRLGF